VVGASTAYTLRTTAEKWLRFHNLLIVPAVPTHPFDTVFTDVMVSLNHAEEYLEGNGSAGLQPPSMAAHCQSFRMFFQHIGTEGLSEAFPGVELAQHNGLQVPANLI
jgi:hypothetical protein